MAHPYIDNLLQPDSNEWRRITFISALDRYAVEGDTPGVTYEGLSAATEARDALEAFGTIKRKTAAERNAQRRRAEHATISGTFGDSRYWGAHELETR